MTMLFPTNRIAQKAIAAGLGLALIYGSVAGSPTSALASSDASITINQPNGSGATYDAYQLFEAEITANDEALHVAWASPAMQMLVLEFLDDNGYRPWLASSHPGDGQHDRAQNALEYLAREIASSRDDASDATPKGARGGSFANRLAQHLITRNATSRQATSGTPFTGSEGYWLFVSSPSSTQELDSASTAPIWVALGGSTSTIDEKSAIPTVSKQVKEDSKAGNDGWGTTADANIGQEVCYRLTGTLPANFDAYDSYHYRFDDSFSSGLDLVLASGNDVRDALTITIDGKPVDPGDEDYEASWSDRTLSVSFPNLKSSHWDSYEIHENSVISVEYRARLNDTASIGPDGNDNTVRLTYSNNPLSDDEGTTTPPPSPKLFTYLLQILKKDKQTDEPLAGASFTIRVSEQNSDEQSVGMYVQADGSLGSAPHEFVSGEDGLVAVEGIDEGSYVVAETKAPDGYAAIGQEILVDIVSNRDEASVSLAGLEARVSAAGTAEGTDYSTATLHEVDSSSGVIRIHVADDRKLALPLTGMAGAGGSGGAIVATAVGIALWLRRHRQI